MKTIVVFCLFTSTLFAQPFKTGKDIITHMHKKYVNGPCKSYSFSQKNIHYKADTISGRSVWHENVEFPDKFRIHFGDRAKGNYIVFKNDSAFNFKDNKLMKSRVDSNSLLLLLGGLYYRDINDVNQRISKAGYDIEKYSKRKWKNVPVFVIGATGNDTTSNQFWVEQKTFRVVRIIEKMGDSETMDMRFESYQPWCKGYIENKVSFRRNGKLEQEEEYYDIKKTESFW